MRSPATQAAACISFVRATSKAKKAVLLLFFVAVLLAGGATAARGQSALDGFDPNANGTISVVVVQPDGKILIGGGFSTVLGVPRNRIARLNPDGTLDTAFNPNEANTKHFATKENPNAFHSPNHSRRRVHFICESNLQS